MKGIRSILYISENAPTDLLATFSIDIANPHIDQLIVDPETSIGIEDVRNLREFAASRPFNVAKKEIVLLRAETLTTEAQNALLKLLEEPPDYLTTILVAPNTQPFLETLLSRCAIIRSHPSKPSGEVEQTLIDLLSLKPPQRLAEIPLTTKSKVTAITFCTGLVHEAKEALEKTPDAKTLHNLKLLNQCLDHLHKNANPTMALNDAVLHLTLPS